MTKKNIVLNRNQVIACINGVLVDRKADGSYVCGDIEEDMERAEKIMDEGGTLYLTDNSGVVITKMVVEDETYMEKELEEGEDNELG